MALKKFKTKTPDLKRRIKDEQSIATFQDLNVLVDYITLLEATIDTNQNKTEYVALLNQTSTNAPVATVVYDNTGETIGFTYHLLGVYKITGIPDLDKAHISIQNRGTSTKFGIQRSGGEVFIISSGETAGTFALANGLLTDVDFKIEIYQ